MARLFGRRATGTTTLESHELHSSHTPDLAPRRRPGAWQGSSRFVATAFATGLIGYVDTNGDSMEPLYHTGDLVVVVRADQYHAGEVVAYHGGTDGQLVALHRIVGGNANGFVIKGDNNRSIDPTHPRAGQIIGQAVLEHSQLAVSSAHRSLTLCCFSPCWH